MPNQAQLDALFHSLADPTRRAVLTRLAAGPAPMTELARPFSMALPSFAQHLSLLEKNGLVKSRKTGRVRTYRLAPRALQPAEHWLQRQRALWDTRLNQLDTYLLELKENESA